MKSIDEESKECAKDDDTNNPENCVQRSARDIFLQGIEWSWSLEEKSDSKVIKFLNRSNL